MEGYLLKLTKDVCSGVFFMILGIVVFSAASGFPASPALLPRIVSAVLLLLSIMLVVRGLRGRNEDTENSLRLTDIDPSVLFLGIFVLGFLLLTRPLGFLASSLLFIVITFYYLGFRSAKIFITGVIFVVISNFVFSGLLNLNLPKGTLWTFLFR
jgi:hypothetical protein